MKIRNLSFGLGSGNAPRRSRKRPFGSDPERGLRTFFLGECPLRPLRLVPDDTRIQFMRGRFAGVIVSAVLSTLSIVLFFYPGLNLGVDFRGGILVELRGSQALLTDAIRDAFAPLGFGDLRVQELVRREMFWCALKTRCKSRTRNTESPIGLPRRCPMSRSVGSRLSAPRSAPSCFTTACSRPGSPWPRC